MSRLPLFRLNYFPIHGRALPIRLAAVLNNIQWEDRLIKRDEFMKNKNDGLIPKWGGLPEITFYNQSKANINIGQSTALLRYIGQLKGNNNDNDNYNLYPTNNKFNCLLIDEIMDSMEDLFKLIIPSFHEQDDKKKLEMRKDLTDNPQKFPLFFNQYNKLIQDNGNNGYFVGDNLSILDLKMFSFLSLIHPDYRHLHFMEFDGIRDDFLGEYRNLYKHVEMMGEQEQIQSFMQSFKEISTNFIKDGTKQEMLVEYPLIKKLF